VNLVKIVVFIFIVGVVHSVNPRIRIDQSVKYFLAIIFISFAGLAFALVGT
jgi:formate hydrogenlyase subunit 4